jgi:hypothetical protein
MTVNAPARAVIDLGARASVLDAMDRVRAAPPADELVLAIAAGAPVLRSAVFLEVLRRASGARRVALVTPDARARSLATSVHVPAFASIAALERQELDATEPLGPARRAAIVATEPRRSSRVRRAGVAASLVAALLVLAAVVAPTATITVAPVSQSLGPLEYDLRAGPSGDMGATTLGPASITAKFTGTATGSRTDETKAKGVERFTNQTTSDIRIAKGTFLRTSDNIPFQTTEDKTLPKSSIVIFPPSVSFGSVDIAIEAVEPGPRGNVDAKKINVSSSPGQYSVENPASTAGGDSKKIPIVLLADYSLAASRTDAELKKQADAQVETWRKSVQTGQTIFGVLVRSPVVTPAGNVVGTELKVGETTFELTATGTATGYSVSSSEPRKTAVERLGTAADSGFDIDKEGAIVEIVGAPSVEPDGVHWRVRARASQFRRPDEAAIRAALAGRRFEEVSDVVRARDLELRTISTWPGWWPRLPVLDSRIKIQSEARAASTR